MAEAALRRIDRIDLAPRWTSADAHRLNNMFRGTDTAEMLRTVLGEAMLGDVAVVSSFGTESAVLLHLVASIDRQIPVLFLETGKHFAETLAYRDALETRLGLRDLRNLTPDADMLARKDGNGLRWSFDPDGCCEIRKVLPLETALAGFDASITGRKAFQAETRAALPRFELDGDRLKFNPLIGWDKAAIDAYFTEHDLPRHPLEAEGYPSIGCAPCTSKVRPGEDPRSGRWAGWDKTECGIHTVPDDGDPDQPSF
ncbi:phosphoadenylyl-sulfate reductase [Sphingomonas japonica]|uniref:Adenosine 5'-phosphosulfate reductase n=1 Tax=Sphingomonas japonica TaxID=511662 RepID=A0ABX0U4C2_9SPHN|nr:phosphoadenylyl-sulfate reductase [Sphingomonas japonica]NIJ24516.1 phosphoadenosine phosphosulfate reductase [Sphingomonas japonica]